MHKLTLLQIGLAIFALELLPESWIMRVSFPLLRQLLNLFFLHLAVVALLQLCLQFTPLDARLSGFSAKNTREVGDVARPPIAFQMDILAVAAAITAIVSLLIRLITATNAHLDLRDSE